MPKIFFCCLILAGSLSSLRSLPVIVPNSFRLPGSALDFGGLKRWDDTQLLQNIPVFLDKEGQRDSDDIFSKEGFSLDTYNMDDSIKEELFDKHPRISLLSRLQSKERKQYKKRAGNLSECFWKYCV
ncbi:urotensin-2 [Hyperolius riggenbachi]|uniref:urotensin-2 n=1 Tax=Hyperolius riggenbachi TaxID=752182 RepID=UPI0035A34AF7